MARKTSLTEVAKNKAKAAKEKPAVDRRIAELERLVERQAAELERARNTTFSLPTGKPRKETRGAFCRVIVPDSHGSHIEPAACESFLSDLERIDPAEIVMLGDHIDCGGFLAQHHTMGYVAETEYTFANDVSAANQFLDAIQLRSPKAHIHVLEGNHERRIERWIVTQTLRSEKDAEFLRGMLSAPVVLNAEKRGLRWYEQGKFHQNLPLPATIKLGKCYFAHGEYAGLNSARKHLVRYGDNVVFGHTHQIDHSIARTVSAGVVGAWSIGCLCKLQPYWSHTNLTNWSHAYGLQIVQPCGMFLHITVPIIEGRSLLAPLATVLGRRRRKVKS